MVVLLFAFASPTLADHFAPPSIRMEAQSRIAARAPLCGPSSGFQPAIGRFGVFGPPPLRCSGDLYELPQQPLPGQSLILTVPPKVESDKKPNASKSEKGQQPEEPYEPGLRGDFSPDPCYDYQCYNTCGEQNIYGGKYLVPTQRPLGEWGLPFYGNGPIPASEEWCGSTNLVQQKLYIYGDYRIGFAQNQNLNREATVLAHRLNLELDYWITSTERLHMFTGPFQDGGNFMRLEEGEFFDELEMFSDNTDTLFFEGDFGQILGGFENTLAPFDMPFTVGLVPMLLQNGVWMQDAFWGAAATLPAKNSPLLDWSNFDVTFFTALDQVSTDAFGQSPHSAEMYGATTFIESRGGYLEAGYAFVDDRAAMGRSYHNVGLSYTRRYLNRVSNSVRVIVNTGQDGPENDRTADGVLFLVENSLLTKNPYNLVPYVNFFAGFGRPQSAARAAAFGGVLFNTGILFQTDALTGYPTLDPTGNDTAGVAVGVDLLGDNFSQQLIVEAAALHAYGDDPGRSAPGNQYGVGVRWQLPVSNAHLIRADAMYGATENARDISGARVEFRWKF